MICIGFQNLEPTILEPPYDIPKKYSDFFKKLKDHKYKSSIRTYLSPHTPKETKFKVSYRVIKQWLLLCNNNGFVYADSLLNYIPLRTK